MNRVQRERAATLLANVEELILRHRAVISSTAGFHAAAQRLWSKIHAMEESAPFREPVGNTVPGYRRKIASPMSLDVVRVRLIDGTYKTADDFVADMRLIVSNSYSFNEPGSLIVAKARKIEIDFEEEAAERFAGQPCVQRAPPTSVADRIRLTKPEARKELSLVIAAYEPEVIAGGARNLDFARLKVATQRAVAAFLDRLEKPPPLAVPVAVRSAAVPPTPPPPAAGARAFAPPPLVDEPDDDEPAAPTPPQTRPSASAAPKHEDDPRPQPVIMSLEQNSHALANYVIPPSDLYRPGDSHLFGAPPTAHTGGLGHGAHCDEEPVFQDDDHTC